MGYRVHVEGDDVVSGLSTRHAGLAQDWGNIARWSELKIDRPRRSHDVLFVDDDDAEPLAAAAQTHTRTLSHRSILLLRNIPKQNMMDQDMSSSKPHCDPWPQ